MIIKLFTKLNFNFLDIKELNWAKGQKLFCMSRPPGAAMSDPYHLLPKVCYVEPLIDYNLLPTLRAQLRKKFSNTSRLLSAIFLGRLEILSMKQIVLKKAKLKFELIVY